MKLKSVSSVLIVLDSCWSSLGQKWLWGGASASFFSLTPMPFFKRLNLPLSVSKPTVIWPEFLWKVRWLPRFSQPVQCKDRKSQGSTPHTPTSNLQNFNAASKTKKTLWYSSVWRFPPPTSMTLIKLWFKLKNLFSIFYLVGFLVYIYGWSPKKNY